MEAKIRFSKKKKMCQVSVKIRMLTNLRLGDTKKSDKETPKKSIPKKR